MKRFLVEREKPQMGRATPAQWRERAQASNAALAELAPAIQWIHSYVADDKVYCVYLARDADVIREHARMTGLPVTRIAEIGRVIDPTTAKSA